MNNGAQFLRREVVPQAITARHEAIPNFELINPSQSLRGILLSAQTASEQVGLRMGIGLVFRDFSFVY